ncbi:hypothetical protein GF412_04370 [Candidatus Micrarchaeota archaeon]|nr:hypothetical protein [Candidatus Micrarchaeota archaeon]MBD3418186.1 hypothetical protein [Candidatus Micrarchaeota archaeon]
MAARKGQVAIEFLMYAGLFMIIAIAAYVLTSFTERGEISLRESQLVNAFGYKFASAPTITYKGGEGFTYDASFPKKLEARDYNVTYICNEEPGEDKRCYIQFAWAGTYQEFVYPYVIAPANYERAPGQICIDDISSSSDVDVALLLTPGKSDGHIYFKNTGIEEGEEYPTIELYCELEED